MFGLINKLIKHLKDKGDEIGVQLCVEIGNQFVKEFQSVNRANERRIFKRKSGNNTET